MRRPPASPAFLALSFAVWIVLASGCAPVRHRLAGEEARGASRFFASSSAVVFPLKASFSGVALLPDRAVPLVAAVDARTGGDETVGLYDPLGRAVLFLFHSEGSMLLSRGEAFETAGLPSISPGGVRLQAGPISVGRVLSGAPGYPIGDVEPARGADGEWVLEDGRQTLFSDPGRRFIARAEYDVSGKRVVVSYPERRPGEPPGLLIVEVSGTKISLRRDEE